MYQLQPSLSILFQLDDESYEQKIKNVLEFYHSKKLYYFIDANGLVQFNLNKLNNLPLLLSKLNDSKELIKSIYFNYEFIYAKCILGDFEFLSVLRSHLLRTKSTNFDIVIIHKFFEIYANELKTSPLSFLEMIRLALFDSCSERPLFQQFFNAYSETEIMVNAVLNTNGKKFSLDKRSALVPFNTHW